MNIAYNLKTNLIFQRRTTKNLILCITTVTLIPNENKGVEMKITNYLASFQAGPLSRSNSNLKMLVFWE